MKKLILLTCVLITLLPSCKPTEKGYKAAYDAAVGKREAVVADIDVTIPSGGLQEVDGAQLKQVDGVNVYVLNQYLKPVDTEAKVGGKYNVAIGKYKMITNCKAQVENLIKDGFEAFIVKDTEGLYYTIAGSFVSLSEAVSFYKKYEEGKDRVYVGLPKAPVIIFSPR